MDEVNKQQNIPNLLTKGEQIYKSEITDKKYEKKFVGQYVAIDVEAEEIFIGVTKEDALKQASTKYPNKIFYVRRIGSLDVVSSRAYSML